MIIPVCTVSHFPRIRVQVVERTPTAPSFAHETFLRLLAPFRIPCVARALERLLECYGAPDLSECSAWTEVSAVASTVIATKLSGARTYVT